MRECGLRLRLRRSLLFGWGFGAFITARNWKLLGDETKSKRSMYWFYSSLAFLFLAVVTPDNPAMTLLFRGLWFAMFLTWGFFDSEPQRKYVKELFDSGYQKKSWLKPLGISAGCLVGFLLLAVIGAGGAGGAGGGDPDVEEVKTGSLEAHPGIAMGPLVDNFLGNPKWSSGITPEGQRYVNVAGDMSYQGKKVRALIQFAVTDDNFEIYAFEMNGIPQNDLMKLGLIAKMYEEFKSP